MRRERTCLLINRVRYHDQLNGQNRERSWLFLMSVVFIMSTDEQLDFSFGTTAGPRVKRVLSGDATLGLWSPAEISRVYIAVDDRYVSKKNRLYVTGIFFDEI